MEKGESSNVEIKLNLADSAMTKGGNSDAEIELNISDSDTTKGENSDVEIELNKADSTTTNGENSNAQIELNIEDSTMTKGKNSNVEIELNIADSTTTKGENNNVEIKLNLADSTTMKGENSNAEIELNIADSTTTTGENSNEEIEQNIADSTTMNGENSNAEIKLNLADSIKQRLQDLQKKQLNAYDFTISRVPPDMFNRKEKYFEPSVISIGPYHRGKDKYQAMEHHKWGQLQDFLARNRETNVETLVEKLRSLEVRAKRCYFEPIKLSSDGFVEMLLLDGCFILEFLLKKNFEEEEDGDEEEDDNDDDNDNNDDARIKSPISKHSAIIDQIHNDMLLLENQIPFFVMRTLLDCLNLEGFDCLAVVTKNLEVCIGQVSVPNDETNIYHLLHLVRHHHFPPELEQADTADFSKCFLLKSCSTLLYLSKKNLLKSCSTLFPAYMCPCLSLTGDQSDEESPLYSDTVGSAKRLQDAGITFKKKKSARTFIDITFSKGVLKIPRISINNDTGRLYMNLVAFEQSILPVEKRHLTSYMSFMDCIIDIAEDVKILEQTGILKSYLNSDETALFFNRIVDYADNGTGHLMPVGEKVNMHTKSCWRRWRANFTFCAVLTFCTVCFCSK